jgi:hypothetical protein
LHVVLPTQVDAFLDQSVTPYGTGWRERFEVCLDRAESLRTMTSISGAYEPLATQLAAEVAMGSAVLNARQLESEAVQLLVVDEGDGPYGTGIATAREGLRWAANGARQYRVPAPRTNGTQASGSKISPEGRADRCLAAMLHIAIDGLEELDEARFADAVDQAMLPLRERVAALPVAPIATLPSGNALVVAFDTAEDALAFSEATLKQSSPEWTLRIAGHYALAHNLASPATLAGRGITELSAIAASAMPGVFTVSETLASVLSVAAARALQTECVGETVGMRLFSVIPDVPGS